MKYIKTMQLPLNGETIELEGKSIYDGQTKRFTCVCEDETTKIVPITFNGKVATLGKVDGKGEIEIFFEC